MTNLCSRGRQPFWQQGSTNLVKFVILLHQGWMTASRSFKCTNTSSTRTNSPAESRKGSGTSPRTADASSGQTRVPRHARTDWVVLPYDVAGTRTWAEWSTDPTEVLESADIPYTIEHATAPARWPTRPPSSQP